MGRYWGMRVNGSVSLGPPGVDLGASGSVSKVEIRDMNTGEIGTFQIAAVEVGVGIGVGVSIGNGDWAYFKTANNETLESFEGMARTQNLQVGDTSVMSRITVPVDLEYGGFWANLWNGDSVDVSSTTNTIGLGVGEGVGTMSLVSVRDGPPGGLQMVREAAREAINEYYEQEHMSRRDPDAEDDGAPPPEPLTSDLEQGDEETTNTSDLPLTPMPDAMQSND
jgi:hypothetical protein